MILDTSALLAILLGEPDAALYAEAMKNAARLLVSAPTLTEAMIVVAARKGGYGVVDLQRVLREAKIVVVPIDEKLAIEAFEAWMKYGKGNHPAGLNYGDCFSYALARALGEPLLFKGEDFSQTDIRAAQIWLGE